MSRALAARAVLGAAVLALIAAPKPAGASVSSRALVRWSSGCWTFSTLPGARSSEPLVPWAAGYPALHQVPSLVDWCVVERDPATPPETLLLELQRVVGESDVELLPLAIHRQAVVIDGPKSAARAETAHAEFLEATGFWSTSGGASPGTRPVHVVVLDDVARTEAERACPASAGPACAWPEAVASARGGKSHGAAVAEVIRELACPEGATPGMCEVRLGAEQVLEFDIDLASESARPGSSVGDVVSLIRGVLRALEAHARHGDPLILNFSVGLDERALGALAAWALDEALEVAIANGALLVSAAGNEHQPVSQARSGILAPASRRLPWYSSKPNRIRTAHEGWHVVAVGLGRDGHMLAMSQFASLSAASENFWYAPAQDVAPFARIGLPVLYTGTSFAAAVTTGILAAGWNAMGSGTAAALALRLEQTQSWGHLPPVESDVRMPIPASASTLPVYQAKATEILSTALGARVEPAAPRPRTPHLSVDQLARSLAAGAPRVVPTSFGQVSPGASPNVTRAVNTHPFLVPQPPAGSCSLCAVIANSEIVLSIVPGSGQVPMEVDLFTSSSHTYLSVPPSPYDTIVLPIPSSLVGTAPVVAGRVTLMDAKLGSTTATDLAIVP